jgi:hypothetical protein
MQPGYAPPFADETDPGRLVKYCMHVIYSQHPSELNSIVLIKIEFYTRYLNVYDRACPNSSASAIPTFLHLLLFLLHSVTRHRA